MSVYLGKERKYATGDVTAKLGTVLQLVRRVDDKDHKLYMDSYFSSPRFFTIRATERLVLVLQSATTERTCQQISV
jgi:calcineurin-like phosphoesterase family protein